MTEITYYKSRSLTNLPDDVLLQVFFFLNADDVLSLSQTCRKLHGISNYFAVWHNVFLNLLHRARYIDVLAIDKRPLNAVKTNELKKSLVLASSAEKNWLSETPKARVPSQVIDLKRAVRQDISLEQSAYITKFTSRHILVPFEGGNIAGWDLKNDAPCGSLKVEPDCIMVDLALDKSTRTLVGLMARVAPVRFFENSFGMHVRLGALRIAVPEPGSNEPLVFERSKQMTLLVPFSSEVHLLDASRRMLCAAFCLRQSNHMGLLVVFDWEAEEAAIIDTGIPYDYGRSLIGVHLSPNGDALVLVSEDEGSEVRRWYDLSQLNPSHHTWNALEQDPGPVIAPSKQQVFQWRNEPPELSKSEGTNAYVFWAIDQLPEPPYPEVPPRVSTLVLYVTVKFDEETGEARKTWRVAQYYSDRGAQRPCADARNVLTLINPATAPNDPDEHGMLIVCLSFNHFGWVEEVEVEVEDEDEVEHELDRAGPNEGATRTGTGTCTRRERRLKLVTFPDPGTTYDGDLADTARTLDVPPDVLEDAYHVLLDATQGLIIVATEKQTLHVYRY